MKCIALKRKVVNKKKNDRQIDEICFCSDRYMANFSTLQWQGDWNEKLRKKNISNSIQPNKMNARKTFNQPNKAHYMLTHDVLDKQLLYYYSLATRYNWWGSSQSGDDTYMFYTY